MGLESINFAFVSDVDLNIELPKQKHVYSFGDNKYVCKEDDKYWIDIMIIDKNHMSIRIALCNPSEDVLNGFWELLSNIFMKDCSLYCFDFKIRMNGLDESVRKMLNFLFYRKKESFKRWNGDIVAAISADDFYKLRDGS